MAEQFGRPPGNARRRDQAGETRREIDCEDTSAVLSGIRNTERASALVSAGETMRGQESGSG